MRKLSHWQLHLEIILQFDSDSGDTTISITREQLYLVSSNDGEFTYETKVLVSEECPEGNYSVYILTKCGDKLKVNSGVTVKVFEAITVDFNSKELNATIGRLNVFINGTNDDMKQYSMELLTNYSPILNMNTHY